VSNPLSSVAVVTDTPLLTHPAVTAVGVPDVVGVAPAGWSPAAGEGAAAVAGDQRAVDGAADGTGDGAGEPAEVVDLAGGQGRADQVEQALGAALGRAARVAFAVGAGSGGGDGVEGGVEQGTGPRGRSCRADARRRRLGGQGELLAVGGLDLLPL